MKQMLRKQYHWIVAAALLLGLAMYGGVVNNYSSLHLLPVTEELGISRGSFALVTSCRSLVAFLVTLVSDRIFLRFGCRKPALIGFLSAAAALLLGSASQNLAVLTVASGLLGCSEALCMTACASRVVGNWFHRHRGLVLGLVLSASGVGSGVLSLVLTGVITAASWRMSFVMCAGVMLLMFVIYLLAVRDRPEDLGLRPYGEGQLPEKKRHRSGMSADAWPGLPVAKLERSMTFWLMLICTLLAALCVHSAFYVQVAHMQDRGLDASQAALMQSLMMLILTAGKLGSGVLCDWLGAKRVTLGLVLLSAVGLWLLAGVKSVPSAVLALVVFSPGAAITTVTIPMLTTALFGYRTHDSIVGIFLSMSSVSPMLALPLANMVFDWLGSYSPLFRVVSVTALAVAGLYLLLYRLADKQKRDALAENNP